MRRVALYAALATAGLACLESAALAHRPPTRAEFRAIRKAIHPQGPRYCPMRRATDVSTINARWASSLAVRNCGAGSLVVRFYLRRPSASSRRWRVVQATSAHGVSHGPPCAGRAVPRDIRCGVRGRS